MMNSLWIAKTGMEAQQTNLDVISHNLANVSTTGYKKVSAQFQDLMYLNLRQVGAQSTEQNQLPTGLQLGLGVRTAATSRNFADGGRQASTGTYDVAIDGKGFFSVTMPDGTTGYTRDGSFKVLNGQIVTNNGYPVDGGITIPNGTSSVTISAQGEVSVVVPSHGPHRGGHHFRDNLSQSGWLGTSRSKPFYRNGGFRAANGRDPGDQRHWKRHARLP